MNTVAVLGWVLLAVLVAVLVWLTAVAVVGRYRRKAEATDPKSQVKLVPDQTLMLACIALLILAQILVSSKPSPDMSPMLNRLENQIQQADQQVLHQLRASDQQNLVQELQTRSIVQVKFDQMDKRLQNIEKRLDATGEKVKPR
jgi:hypothetical protein